MPLLLLHCLYMSGKGKIDTKKNHLLVIFLCVTPMKIGVQASSGRAWIPDRAQRLRLSGMTKVLQAKPVALLCFLYLLLPIYYLLNNLLF